MLGAREHPSPHRDRVRVEALLLALAAGPAAWIFQLSVNFGVAAAICQPGGVPRATPPAAGWGPENVFLICVNLACLALAVAGGFVALAAWRRSAQEKSGGAGNLIEVGEGRTRFMAACAMMAAAGFAVAILFDTAWPFFVPSCWRFSP